MTNARKVATDALILINNKVVLIKRSHSPYEGFWVLPGGHVKYLGDKPRGTRPVPPVDRGESIKNACIREVKEEIGIDVKPIYRIGIFDRPGRDNRGNISIPLFCIPCKQDPDIKISREASDYKLFKLNNLPKMGFDHKNIIQNFDVN